MLTLVPFFAVFTRDKEPVQVLNQLLQLYPGSQMAPLRITTEYDPISATYRSTVRLEGMTTTPSQTAIHLTKEECTRKAQLMAFHFLKDVSKLIGEYNSGCELGPRWTNPQWTWSTLVRVR